MNDDVPVEETLRRQGWSVVKDGHERRFEKDGLRLSFDSHWSVQQYFVSSTTGGWGDMQEIMSKVGLVTVGDDRDFLDAANHRDLIKSYLDSRQFEEDKRAYRHERMNKLREFQREIGMKESFLAGEEDHLRQRSEWKSGFRGVPWKYWIVAVASAVYLVYLITTAENVLREILIVGVGLTIMLGGLFGLRFQKKI